MKCIGSKAKDADLWISIWEEVRRIRPEGMLLEVEHVRTHRTKKERQEMTLFEKFVTDGNERAGELAKDGAIWDGGEMAQVGASTVQQQRDDVFAALQCAAGFHYVVEDWKDCEELKPQTEDKWTFCR